MKPGVLMMLASVAGCAGLVILLALRLRYRITERHLKVTLFGVCLRRIHLSDIERVTKRPVNRAEKWHNTLRPAHRVLVIRRRHGWFRDFVITPKNRYVFKSELEQAMTNLPASIDRRTSDSKLDASCGQT